LATKGAQLKNWILKVISISLVVLLPLPLFAVELSEIRVYSLLNEPLNAEITLSKVKGISLAETLVSVAERDFYVKSGFEPLSWVYKIKFNILRNPDTGKTVIKMTTDEPIKDPYVDLLLVTTWPGGKIVREYTLLLDPPKIAVPSLQEATFKPFKTQTTLKKTSVSMKSAVKLTTNQEFPQVPGQVASVVKHRASARRLERAQSRVIRPGGHYGPICDETLWSIAKRLVENSPYSVYQGVAAIAHKNPTAFRYGNINSMSEGAILDLPTPQELGSLTKFEAQSFVEAQNQDWQQGNERMPALPPPLYPESKAREHRSSKALRLIAPEPETPLSSPSGKHAAMVDEEIDTLKRSNENATQKFQELKNQNDALATQLSEKDIEIQRLREAMQKSQALATSARHNEGFAVAVPDVKKPTSETLPHAQPSNLDLIGPPTHTVPAHDIPKPETKSKMVPTTSLESPSKQSEHAPIKSRSDSVKNVILWLIVLFTLVFILSLTFWGARRQILALLDKWIEKYAPNLAKQSPAPVSVDMPFMTTSRENLHFDLEKALTALSQEQKRYLNLQNSKENEGNEDVTLEDVDVYIAYERYAQAEKILQGILTKTPRHWEALLKLLELYVLTEDYQDFEKWYENVPLNLNEQAPRIWSRIELLKNKVENEKSIKITEMPVVSKGQDKPVKDGVVSNFDLSKKYSLSLEDTDLPPGFRDRGSELRDLLPEVSSEVSSAKVEKVVEPEPIEAHNEDVQSQITLAKAYIDIGDYESAREFLIKAMTLGSPAQKQQVQELLDRISKSK
jgi:pilus assembly protein FimV